MLQREELRDVPSLSLSVMTGTNSLAVSFSGSHSRTEGGQWGDAHNTDMRGNALFLQRLCAASKSSFIKQVRN